jgi:hypothetical protein
MVGMEELKGKIRINIIIIYLKKLIYIKVITKGVLDSK